MLALMLAMAMLPLNAVFALMPMSEPVEINEANFPDGNFRDYIAQNYDFDRDGSISEFESSFVTSLFISNMGISDLTGIEHFSSLQSLYCDSNSLTQFDLSHNTALTYLDCSQNAFTELDISGIPSLTTLLCNGNAITTLDLSNNPALTVVSANSNALSQIDLSSNAALIRLTCSNNYLTNIDISGCTSLSNLNCDNNRLTELNLGSNTALQFISCSGNNLASLDADGCSGLLNLTCMGNTYNYPGFDDAALRTIDLSKLSNFDVSRTSDWRGGSISGNILTFDRGVSSVTYTYRCSDLFCIDFSIKVPEETIPVDPVEDVEINEINFPDEKFRECVRLNCDFDNDGYISEFEGSHIVMLFASNEGISDLTGIEFLPGLQMLYCGTNNLTKLDLSHNTALTFLDCSWNMLTELDLSSNTELVTLNLGRNALNSIDLSNNIALTTLYIGGNALTELDLSSNTSLNYLTCVDNYITELDLSNNSALTTLFCTNNHLTELDLSSNSAITLLNCSGNNLACLNLNSCYGITDLFCSGNIYYYPTFDDEALRTIDLSSIPNFDISRASDWKGGSAGGSILTVDHGVSKVTYTYSCTEGHLAEFTIKAGAGSRPVEPNRPAFGDFIGYIGFDPIAPTMTWSSFTDDEPETLSRIGTLDNSVTYAACTIGTEIYGYNFVMNPHGNDTRFYHIDSVTLVKTYLGSSAPENHIVLGMAYDYKNELLYAMAAKDDANQTRALYIVDIETGEMIFISDFLDDEGDPMDPTDPLMTFAIDNNGIGYGISYLGSFYSIELENGHCTYVGATEQNLEAVQSMTWDMNTNQLFWAQYHSATGGRLLKLDPQTGAVIENCGTIGYGSEVLGLCTLYDGSDPEPSDPVCFSIGIQDACVGDIIDIPVEVSNYNGDAHILNMSIGYFAIAFEVTGVTYGDLLTDAPEDSLILIDHETIPGSVRVSVVCPTDPLPAGDGHKTIITLHVRILEAAANATCPVFASIQQFQNFPIGGEVTDIAFNSYTGAVIVSERPSTHTVLFLDWDGTVLDTQIVESGASASAPEVPIRGGYAFTGWDVDFSNVQSDMTVTAQYWLLGDANCDGFINPSDVVLIARFSLGIAGSYSSEAIMDVNRDGIVNNTDALLLLRYTMGITQSL